MSSTRKPQDIPRRSVFAPIPDPWDMPEEDRAREPTLPRIVPLDPSHELTGMPIPEAIMPEGIPGVLRLSQMANPIRSEIAILLEDEMKLADRASEHLRTDIRDAITCLELAYT